MRSRENILDRVKAHQPSSTVEERSVPHLIFDNRVEAFKSVLTQIGGTVIELKSIDTLSEFLCDSFGELARIISPQLDPLSSGKHKGGRCIPPVAVLRGRLGVAESGSVWLTEDNMMERSLPFVCEHLVLVLESDSIVSNLAEAYAKIGDSDYEFGTFIAGPSKTADIEQSLVLGAHGPKSLTVCLV